ncbi:PAS domain S-box protein [Planctomycetota bacterium]
MKHKKMNDEPFIVLLVEDDPDHVELIIRSFKDNRVANEIQHVSDGEAALDYLFRRGDYADPQKSPRPHVILLDIRLPKIDGLEVLKEIKTSEELHKIPVVILTTSDAEKDITEAYENYANSYLVKPVDFEKFTQLMSNFVFYWFGWNRYPEEEFRALFENAQDGIVAVNKKGAFKRANEAAAKSLGYTLDEFLRLNMADIETKESREEFEKHYEDMLKEKNLMFETFYRRKDGSLMNVDVSLNVIEAKGKKIIYNVWHDITERKQIEKELRASRRFLEITNQHMEMESLLNDFIGEIRKYTGCAAAGIRILDEEGNIPYQAYEGFSRKFYDSESPLTIHEDKCMCINVIRGDIDPKQPFYTENGSFYMNGTTRFLATVSPEQKGETRNVCNEFGYESVALVPISLGNCLLGLIHIADPQENMLPLEMIEVLERAAKELGAAIKRISSEKALRQSEEKYRKVITTATDAVMIFDADTRKFIEVNQATQDLYGYSREEFLNLRQIDITAEVRESDDSIEKTIKGELVKIPLRYHRKKDGEVFPVEICTSTFNLDGRCVICGVIRDITERIRAEQEIKNLAKFPSENPYPILRISSDGNILYANPASRPFLSDLGIEIDEVIPVKWRKLTSESLRSSSMKQTDIKHDGKIISFIIVPVQESKYVNWYGRDVTKQSKLVEQEKMHRAELARISQAHNIGQMASELAHELNQPLCSIATCAQGCLRMIQRETNNPDILKGIKEIVKQSKRAGDIVHSIRGFVSKHEPRKSTCDINVILQDAVRIKGFMAGHNNVSVQFNLWDSLPPILGDPIQIEQVIMNLIQNAFEAMEEISSDSHKLNITSSLADNDAIEVAISDTGNGLQPETAKQMFNSFYTTKSQGMGIGLSICQSIINAHHGQIWATSNHDQGTTLRFTLPVNK